MTETYESERRKELTSLLDVARAISPDSQEIAKRSKIDSGEENEVLALTKLLDDDGKANRILFEILKDTPTGEKIKKYLNLTDERNQEGDLIVDTRKNFSSSGQDKKVIVLYDENNKYQIVRFEKSPEQPYEIDVINTEEEDRGFSVNPETARKLDELINNQREIYESNLTELARTTF
ncbi:MAG: hypothetical protein ACOX0R_02790 [Candidatus Dojkabacteria bacterium]|jgi:hypothetical protein